MPSPSPTPQAGGSYPVRRGIILLLGMALSIAMAVEPDDPVITRGAIETDTGKLAYQARVESTRLFDAEGEYSADMVTTSYLAGDDEDSQRPVIFLFNGGPIVPAVYLHMGMFGPYRVQFQTGPQDEQQEWALVENRRTLLDVADLVYVDPPMTGYSRLAEGREPEEFHGIEPDAQQVADFIVRWLRARQREQSPVYIFGESYGTMRAPFVGRKLTEADSPVSLAGIMLFGQAVNMIEYSQRPDNILSYVVSLPTLSVIAQYHHQSAFPDLDADTLYRKARRYASEHYLPALFKGNTIAEGELEKVAARLEQFTGISAQYYVDNRLRISKEEFRRQLITEPPTVLGRYDARYTGPRSEDEPSDPAAPLGEAYLEAFSDYRENHLQIDSDTEYVPRAGISDLGDWDWLGNSPFSHFHYAAQLDYLFNQVDDFRLYVASGHYDLTTTTGAADHLVRQSFWPRERVMVRRYASGHMAYTDEESARRIVNDIREFIGASQ